MNIVKVGIIKNVISLDAWQEKIMRNANRVTRSMVKDAGMVYGLASNVKVLKNAKAMNIAMAVCAETRNMVVKCLLIVPPDTIAISTSRNCRNSINVRSKYVALMRNVQLGRAVILTPLAAEIGRTREQAASHGPNTIAAKKTLAPEHGYVMQRAENVGNRYATKEGPVRTIDTNVWTFSVYQKAVTIWKIHGVIAWSRKAGTVDVWVRSVKYSHAIGTPILIECVKKQRVKTGTAQIKDVSI